MSDRLAARYGADAVHMDVDDLPAPPELRKRIEASLERACVVLAVVSPNWLGGLSDPDDAVCIELDAALARGIPVIPVLVDATPLPQPAALPGKLAGLARLETLPLNSGRDFHLHVERVIRAIDQALKAPPARRKEAAPQVGERRQITVMFCDLVGSTALATRLDPEDMRLVIGAFQGACARVIPAHGGLIARYMGDGVLAYFGYPRAHEDDAEQAVRAALELVAAIAAAKSMPGLALQGRAGLATGLVVIGDLIGEGIAQERQVVGEPLNMAARLEALAEPGSVLVGPGTHRLLGRLFDCRDRGAFEMKGFSAPVQAWQVLRASAVDSRFDALRSTEVDLIGRKDEMDLAMRHWQQAQAGHGCALLVSGEAGIGKSRIAASLGEWITAQGHTRLSYQCSPYHSNSALYPMIVQLERAAGFAQDDPPERRLDKLERMLALAVPEPRSIAPFFAALLSIPAAGRYPPLNLTAAQQRRKVFEGLLAQLEGLARARPVLVVFEDAHWADATSLEVLSQVLERIAALPVLLLLTCRPEFEPRWAGRPNFSMLALGRLEREHVRTLIGQVTKGQVLPPEVLDQIVTKTDGIPLFVEELTKSVLESQLLVDEGGSLRVDGALPALAIPATLKDSLMARLDRLAPVAQVVQAGAAIGRTFSWAMIAAVSGQSDEALSAALQSLIDAGLIFRRGAPPHTSYLFKHALIQDAAYESMLRSRRGLLHARIVQAIETHFPEMAETTPELVAHHCVRAELADKAIDYLTRAGQRSLGTSSLAEAVSHFKSAIALLAAQPGTAESRRRELACQTGMAQALIGAKGYGAPETMAAWQRGYELAETVGDAQQSFAVTYGLWVGKYAQGQLATIDALAEACLRAAEALGDRTQLCVANRMTGIANFIVGNFAHGVDYCTRAVELYDPATHPPLANQLGHDLLVAGLCFKALSLWPLGRDSAARSAMEAALAHAGKLGHPPSLAYSYWHAGIIGGLMLSEEAAVAQHADALVALSDKHGLTLWAAWGRVAQGWAQARAGGGAAAAERTREGLLAARRTGNRIYETTVLALLGEAQAAAGDADGGIGSIAEGIEFAEASRQLYWLSELYRLHAALLARTGEKARAERALRRAVAVAQEQKAPAWERRAAADLAIIAR